MGFGAGRVAGAAWDCMVRGSSMTDRSRANGWRIGIWLGVWMLGASMAWSVTPEAGVVVGTNGTAGGGSGGGAAAQAADEEPAPSLVTTLNLAQEIGVLEGKSERSAEEETRLKFLKDAQSALIRAVDSRAQAAAFKKLRAEAPALVKVIQDELATPAPDQVPIEVPDGASIEQLEQYLRVAQAEYDALKKAAEEIDKENTQREKRLATLPEELVEAKAQLAEMEARAAVLPAVPGEWTGPQILTAAQIEELRSRVYFLQQELASYDARRELIKLRPQQAQRRLRVAELTRTGWERELQAARQREIEQQQAQARQAERQSADSAPAVVQAIEHNQELTKERADLQSRRQGYERRQQEIRARVATLTESLAQARIRVELVGFNDVVGQFLRNEVSNLPSLRVLKRQARLLQDDTYQIQVRMIELRDELAIAESMLQRPAEEVSENLRQQLTSQSEYLGSLIRDYDILVRDVLLPFELEMDGYISQVAEFRQFIMERILWTRSIPPVSKDDLTELPGAIADLADPDQWKQTGRVLIADAKAGPLPVTLGLMLLVVVWGLRPLFMRRLRTIHQQVRRASTDSFALTLSAFAIAIPLGLAGPLIFLFLGWRLSLSTGQEVFPVAVGSGLLYAGAIYATSNLTRELFRVEGLAQDHFRWRAMDCPQMRRLLSICNAFVLPVYFIVNMVSFAGMEERYLSTVGRLTMMIGMLVFSALLWRVLHPEKGVFRSAYARYGDVWLIRWRRGWISLLLLGMLGLAVLPAIGFFYTSLQLQVQLLEMYCWVIGVVVVRALLMRWLLIAQRTLAMHRKETQGAVTPGPQIQSTVVPGDQTGQADFPAMDLSQISIQSRKLVHTFTVFALLVGMWVTWDDVLPALRILEEQRVWSYWTEQVQEVPSGEASGEVTMVKVPVEVPVTMADLALAILVILGTIGATRNIPGLMEISLLRRLPLDGGARYAITTLSRYFITIVGIIVFCQILGIGWSDVQWLAAAITLGLGFGLQEIFANFVSGLIILFERPMRVGDVVTINNITGSVSRIQMRATTIMDWDRKELIVPNKEFITGQLVNWTLTDTTLRIVIPVGIAYGSDTGKAEEILAGIAQEDPDIMTDPSPAVVFTGFGDNSLNFQLRIFIPRLDLFVPVSHRVYLKINRAFSQEGIEISFPQRDLHLRTVSGPIPVAIHKGKEIELPTLMEEQQGGQGT